MKKSEIRAVLGREILDSRGNPTVEASVVLNSGTVGVASVPSGASTGIHEAHELRDGDPGRYGGRGVMLAVGNIMNLISPALVGIEVTKQCDIDRLMMAIDNTDNKSALGANAILAVSLAVARAAARELGIELYRYLGGVSGGEMPSPMFNVMNGGAHASNNLEIQEFMIVPRGLSASESVRAGSEIYHTLGKILKERGLSTAVGDEGGYAPNLESDESAIELLCLAIEKSGYTADEIGIALDVASSEWCKGGRYRMPKSGHDTTAYELTKYYERLTEKYPIISIEDGLAEDDFDGWHELTEALGKKIMLVGDDLFVTNETRLTHGIRMKAANAILIKPNQIGTLTETMDVIRLAKSSGYNFIISHRSGETEDSFIADLAVATSAPFIKSGAPCRAERTAKYNRLMEIESRSK